MDDRYRLVALGNEQLLAALNGLTRREHFAMADILAHLAELDERRLFLDLGYPSLFAYCREALGYCKSSAGRRIAAARVCRKYPGAFLRVADGQLQLSVVSILASYLNAGNAAELFEACSGKSFEQVEWLLAARFPRSDVRDSIRRLPDAARVSPDMGTGATGADTEVKTGTSVTEKAAHEIASTGNPNPAADQRQTPSTRPTQERLEPLSLDRFGVHFTADADFRELLEEVRALASHSLPKGELLPVMKQALEAYRRELLKQRFAVGAKPRRAAGSAAPALELKRTRRLSAAVRRAVYERDQGKCTFVSDDGRRCGTQQLLELDHVQPWALSGESTVDNLRLRCRAHNQHSARLYFGGTHVREAIERARSKRKKREPLETTRNGRDDLASVQTCRGGGGSADLSSESG